LNIKSLSTLSWLNLLCASYWFTRGWIVFSYAHLYEKWTKKSIECAFVARHFECSAKIFSPSKLLFWNNKPKLERQQNSLWGMIKFYSILCFHDNPCLFGYGDSWIFIQPPFGPLKIRNKNFFFYIEYVWLTFFCFFFGQVKLYAAMGSAYLGQGSIPP
jgi:hypothetical protein